MPGQHRRHTTRNPASLPSRHHPSHPHRRGPLRHHPHSLQAPPLTYIAPPPNADVHQRKQGEPSRDTRAEIRSLQVPSSTRRSIFVIPNPWNAGHRKNPHRIGLRSPRHHQHGYAFSTGRPDTQPTCPATSILQNAKEIVDATHLPVSADLQDGFGPSPETCAATIRLASAIGLAGGSIEDATGDPATPIYDFQLAVERVEAAAETAQTHHFLLTARAENFLHGRPNLDDTISRLQSFAEAGADVLYAPGLPGLEAIREVCASVSKPVNVLMGLQGATFSVEELAAAGVKRISVGGSFARAALGAFIRAAREVKDKGTFTYAADAISHAEVTNFMAKDKL